MYKMKMKIKTNNKSYYLTASKQQAAKMDTNDQRKSLKSEIN